MNEHMIMLWSKQFIFSYSCIFRGFVLMKGKSLPLSKVHMKSFLPGSFYIKLHPSSYHSLHLQMMVWTMLHENFSTRYSLTGLLCSLVFLMLLCVLFEFPEIKFHTGWLSIKKVTRLCQVLSRCIRLNGAGNISTHFTIRCNFLDGILHQIPRSHTEVWDKTCTWDL